MRLEFISELDLRAGRTLINLLLELPITMLVSTQNMKLVQELLTAHGLEKP